MCGHHLQGLARLTILAVCFVNFFMMSVSSTAEPDPHDSAPCPSKTSLDGFQNKCDHLDVSSASTDCRSEGKSAVEDENLALVLYRPTPLAAFQQEYKQFNFVGKEIVIKQKWEDIGVAAVVWDAAVVLSEFLEKKTDTFALRGKSVIELGAGTGLVSMVAALLGADVIATDRKLALEFLQENIKDNLSNPEEETYAESKETSGADCMNIKAMELDWGNNHKEFSPVFDYILGADIIYIEETFEQLLETLHHLAGSDKYRTTVLLSCRIRYERDTRFLGMMEKYFAVEEIHFDESRKIKIYKAQLLS